MDKVTKRDKTLQLTEKQHLAIKEILKGKSDGDVAEEVGVSRKTISQWKNDNPYFQAELNAKREEVWEDYLAKHWQLAENSFETIKSAIDKGDVKTAKWYLEKIGIDRVFKENIKIRPEKGETDPDEILRQKALAMARAEVGRPPAFEAPSWYENEAEIDQAACKLPEQLQKSALAKQKQCLAEITEQGS